MPNPNPTSTVLAIASLAQEPAQTNNSASTDHFQSPPNLLGLESTKPFFLIDLAVLPISRHSFQLPIDQHIDNSI